MLGGGAPRDRGEPRLQSDWALRTGEDDSAKLLRAQKRSAPAGRGPGAGAGVGAGPKSAAIAPGGAQALLPDWARTEGRRGKAGPGPAFCRVGQSGIAGGAKTFGMAQ